MHAYSQELSPSQLDSLYNKFIQLRAPELLPQTDQPAEISLGDRKCGFLIVNDIKSNLEFFSPEKQGLLKTVLGRPTLQTSIVSPSGFFRIHYDASGSNRPSYVSGWTVEQNVAEVAKALDSVYRFEVDYLGFLSPPSDGTGGGDDKYDVYIQNQGGGVYGYTEWESKVGSVNWTSFMVLDNDYTGYYSTGLDGMRVTAAHEFHHGIQLGNYSVFNENFPYRNADAFFYELTSTSMEEFVYDDVNDYYYYIKTYTNLPSRRFDSSRPFTNDGYDLAIWNIYLNKNFGFNIIRQQWELIPTHKAMLSISNTLSLKGTTFAKEFNKFGIWLYYTGIRAIPGLYFEEAAFYPIIKTLGKISFPQYNYVEVDAQVLSNNYIRFQNITNGDSLFALVTNGDINSALNEQRTFIFRYTLYSDTISGERKLAGNYSSDFYSENYYVWTVSEILNNQLIREDSLIIPPASSKSYAFPNPFYYNRNYLTGSFIFFPYDANVGETVDFNVYSVGMQIMFSNQPNIQILPGGQLGVSWHGKDSSGNKLASGVYIYVIKKGSEVVTGKVVIFNE